MGYWVVMLKFLVWYSIFFYVSFQNFILSVFFFLMIRRPPRSTQSRSSAASDVYKRQTYGSGNAPNRPWFLTKMRHAVEQGILVLNVTQCHAGSVDMEKYENGLKLKQVGVVSLSLIHISEPTRLLSISYAVFCLKKQNTLIHVVSDHELIKQETT